MNQIKKYFKGQQIKYVENINYYHNFGGEVHTATITEYNDYFIKLSDGNTLYNSHQIIAIRFC